MAPRTLTRETQSPITARILEQRADHVQSKQQGQLLTLEELPQFLRARTKELEDTAHYKQNGYVWFYLDTTGTQMNGPHRFNSDGKTLKEMFQQVSEKQYNHLPLNQKAYFYGGNSPLLVDLYRYPDFGGRRLGVCGDGSPQDVAPVVVIKQSQAQAQAGSEAAAPKNGPAGEPITIVKQVVRDADKELKKLKKNPAINNESIAAYDALVQEGKKLLSRAAKRQKRH